MAVFENKEKQHSTALTVDSVRLAQQRAQEEIAKAKEALELKTQELTLSLSRMRATLESTTDGILVMNFDEKIADFNQRFVSMWGIPHQILETRSGKDLMNFIPQKLKDPVKYQAWVERIKAGSMAEVFDVLELTDGRAFEQFTKVQFIDHRNIGRIWSFRDVTETKAALEVKTRLAAIIECSQDGIISKTLDGIITTWNKAAERIFGYRADEIIGQPIIKLIPKERYDEEKFILDQLRQGKRVEECESIRVTKDGRYIDVLFTSSPILDPNGKVLGASKIVRDITVRKQAAQALQRTEMELRNAEANAAIEREQLLESERAARSEAERLGAVKDQFLATLSHELRTPLSAILGWSQLLKRPSRTEADLTKGLEVIERNARMQTQLIDDLLDISRITSGKVRLDVQPLHPLSVIEAAIETLRPAAEAKGIRLDKLLDSAAAPVFGDPNRLQQVVWNLLSNAIKFTPNGGRVQIRLSRTDSQITISVTDTGVGIKPEFITHVFERFRQADASTTRAYGGLGLGLAIVKQLVEMHGGTVQVASEGHNQGATFSLQLPLLATRRNAYNEILESPPASSPVSADFRELDLSGIKVLVVDDEADAREFVKRLLAECHAEVITAGTAEEALSLVETEQPQVLVTDIGMPNTDGFELLKRVRALGPLRGGRVPAIAVTAFARSEDRTRILRAGFRVHISKPIEPIELVVTVANVAGRTEGSITIDHHS